MIYIAERENLGRKQMLERAQAALADGESFDACVPPFVTPEFVDRSRARTRDHSFQYQSSRKRTDDHRA